MLWVGISVVLRSDMTISLVIQPYKLTVSASAASCRLHLSILPLKPKTMPTSDARRTIWFKDDTPSIGLATPTASSSTNSPSHTTASSTGGESNARRDENYRHERPLVRKITTRDPWTIYIHKALVRAGHEAYLAIRRDDPAKLVHIQMTRTDLALVEGGVEKVSRFAHHAFLRLLDVLHHQSTCYLVWEPAEFALDRVLISRCRIQEDELGHIIRPVRVRLSGLSGELTVGRL